MSLDQEIDAAAAAALAEYRSNVYLLADPDAYRSAFIAGALWATRRAEQLAVGALSNIEKGRGG